MISEKLKNIPFDNGFLIDGQKQAYFSFVKDNAESGWSAGMADFLEESSQNHFIDRYNRLLVLDKLSLLEKEKVDYLDVGCGSGYLLEEVYQEKPSWNMMGSDYTEQALHLCHRRLPQVPLLHMDLQNCPLSDQSFDFISCLNVLEHINDDSKAIQHLARLLRPDGHLVLTVPAGPHLFDLYDEVHHHFRRYNLKTIQKLCLSAGLKIEESNYFGSFLYPAFWLVKKKNQKKYKDLSLEEKKKLTYELARKTQRSHFMEWVCKAERGLGRRVAFPFGIRAYIYCRKVQ